MAQEDMAELVKTYEAIHRQKLQNYYTKLAAQQRH
jgi:hypothetical protein